MPTLTLHVPSYGSIPVLACSPPSWACRIALSEKGLAHTLELLDYAGGANTSPELLKLNPRGTMPVLTDGHRAVHQTLAILQYVEVAYPDPPLLPRNPDERATALVRLQEAAHLDSAATTLYSWLVDNPDSKVPPDRTQAVVEELQHWERYYVAGTWAAGEELSLADLLVFVHVAAMVRLELGVLEGLTSLTEAYETLKHRRSVTATWPSTWW